MLSSAQLSSLLPFGKQRTRPSRVVYHRPQTSKFLLMVSYTLIALNASVLFSYLLGINAAASTGYEIKKIQQKISVLTEENKKLNLKVSEQSSIASVQADFTGTRYVPITTARFLQVTQISKR